MAADQKASGDAASPLHNMLRIEKPPDELAQEALTTGTTAEDQAVDTLSDYNGLFVSRLHTGTRPYPATNANETLGMTDTILLPSRNSAQGTHRRRLAHYEKDNLKELAHRTETHNSHPSEHGRGYLTKQGWHSINNPSPPWAQYPSKEVLVTPTKHIEAMDDDTSTALDPKYFDPAHYLLLQENDDAYPQREGTTVSTKARRQNERYANQEKQKSKKVFDICRILIDDESGSKLSDPPDDLQDLEKPTPEAEVAREWPGLATRTHTDLDMSLPPSRNIHEEPAQAPVCESKKSVKLTKDNKALHRASTISSSLSDAADSDYLAGMSRMLNQEEDTVKSRHPDASSRGPRKTCTAVEIPDSDSDVTTFEDTDANTKNSAKVSTATHSDRVPTTIRSEAEGDRDVASKDQSIPVGEWELVSGDEKPPRIGQADPDKLRIHLRHRANKEDGLFRFKSTKSDEIDWSSAQHIRAIAQWRRQVFRRHGFTKMKTEMVYAPIEDIWLTLFLEKIKGAAKGGNAVELPSESMVADAFNGLFQGKILRDAKGNKLIAREKREPSSIQGKFTRHGSKIWQLRQDIAKFQEDQGAGTLYVPIISKTELKEYHTKGTVTVDNPQDKTKNAALNLAGDKAERHVHIRRKRKRRPQADEGNDADVSGNGSSEGEKELEKSKRTKPRS